MGAAVPMWALESVGKMVALTEPHEGFPAGHRGVLMSICTKQRWGASGVYATVALDLSDMSYEENCEFQILEPACDLAAAK